MDRCFVVAAFDFAAHTISASNSVRILWLYAQTPVQRRETAPNTDFDSARDTAPSRPMLQRA